VHFSRIDGQWKLDDIPIQLVDTNTARPVPDDKAEIVGLIAFARVIDQIAADVEEGRLKTLIDAQWVFAAQCQQLARQHPKLNTDVSPVPAPVPATKPARF
jgi:hypothetical protein